MTDKTPDKKPVDVDAKMFRRKSGPSGSAG